MKNQQIFLLISLFLLSAFSASAQKYMTPKQLQTAINDLQHSNSAITKIHNLAESYGGNTVSILEIGPDVAKNSKPTPAVFVVGNVEGNYPIASNAAIRLAEMVLEQQKAGELTWYILPVLNPDALTHYFEKPLFETSRNNRPVNDDHDEATDEDGPEDLNGDGLITQMRVVDPEGQLILHPKDNRILRKADPSKGEKGVYKIYTEGIDNDGDGKYNEDPEGGVNNGINFPHLHPEFTSDAGIWPGSEAEVFAVLKFIFEHPEIAMTMTFGRSNFCLVPPKGGRSGSADLNKIRVPENRLEMLGAEKNRTYTIDEIMEMAQPLVPEGVELTPSMLSGLLGLGAVVNPLEEDLKIYKELSDKYKEYLKSKGFSQEMIDPEGAKNGSFELWSYYHLGVHTYSMNFFTLPKLKEEKAIGTGITFEMLEEMTSEDFIELGEEKIDSFLIESNAPEKHKASSIIERVKNGQVTPAQIAGMMKQMPKKEDPGELNQKEKALLAYNDSIAKGKAFVDWQEFDHPTLGKVEIGGVIPYIYSTPSEAHIDSLLDLHLPWVFSISEKLPDLKIHKYETREIGAEVFELSIWVENAGYLPFPTAMGDRNEQPAPAVLLIQGKDLEIISGKSRTPILKIGGLQTLKFRYVLKTSSSDSIQVSLSSVNAGNDNAIISLK